VSFSQYHFQSGFACSSVKPALLHAYAVPIQSKERQWRAEEVVLPRLREEKPKVMEEVRNEMARMGVKGTKDELRAAWGKRVEQLVCSHAGHPPSQVSD
jgi:inner membrane protein COX18